MIGTSLPFDFLLNGTGVYGDANTYLARLKSSGVKSVEIRSVRTHADPDDVLTAATLLIRYGFNITIHGSVKSAETAVSDIFIPLSGVLPVLNQSELIVTVHPIEQDNVSMLNNLADYIIAHSLPVRIALENNRLLPDGTKGDGVALVSEITEAVNRKEIGICFDMGHFCWFTEGTGMIPAKFAKRVIHTHIHAMDNGRTHFPLDCFLPLKEYISSLPHSYYGVYNIELDPMRFAESRDPGEALVKSVGILSSSLPFYTELYDKIRTDFLDNMIKSFQLIGSAETDTFSLIQSTSYIFKYSGIKFVMDFALRDAMFLTDAGKHIHSLFSDYAFHIITHNHADHFDYNTVQLMKDLPMKWIIPRFMKEQAVRYGISEENMIVALPGEKIHIDGIDILPFESRHYRHGTHNGVDELGYLIFSDDSPSLLFPGDIRDYSSENLPDISDVDWLFAHVWLSDSNSDYSTCREYAEKQGEFIMSFKPENVVFAHLYESGRTDNQMWTREHAELVAGYVTASCHIPEPGCGLLL